MWVADRGLARRDADGRVIRMAGSETDITSRKQAEELARLRLVELEDLYSSAPVGMCVLDRELRFIRINQGWPRSTASRRWSTSARQSAR